MRCKMINILEEDLSKYEWDNFFIMAEFIFNYLFLFLRLNRFYVIYMILEMKWSLNFDGVGY